MSRAYPRSIQRAVLIVTRLYVFNSYSLSSLTHTVSDNNLFSTAGFSFRFVPTKYLCSECYAKRFADQKRMGGPIWRSSNAIEKRNKYEDLEICAGLVSEKLLLTGTGLRIARTNRVLIGSGDIKDTTDSGSLLTTSQMYTIMLTPGHG